jgi:hypothetical protein
MQYPKINQLMFDLDSIKMYRYLPSETFDNPLVVETKNKWLNSSILTVINEATDFVLNSNTSSFFHFCPSLKEQLQKSRENLKNVQHKRDFLWVDQMMGYDFNCMLKQIIMVIHEGIYFPENVLYSFQEFLNEFDSAQDDYHEEESFNLNMKMEDKYAVKFVRNTIAKLVRDVVEDHSDEEYYAIRKIELSEIIEKHIYHIVIQLVKLSLSSVQRDVSTCIQEMLLLVSDILRAVKEPEDRSSKH